MSYHLNFKPSLAQSNSLARSVRYNDNKLLVSIIKFVEYLSLNLAENDTRKKIVISSKNDVSYNCHLNIAGNLYINPCYLGGAMYSQVLKL